MKLSLLVFLSTAATVFGFSPGMGKEQVSLVTQNMVSSSVPPGGASPMSDTDPYRKIPIPSTKGRGEVMIEPDWTMPKNVVAMGPALLMMYPCKSLRKNS